MPKSSFKEDLGTLLEMAREVAVKHNQKVSVYVDRDGKGFTSHSETNMDIGFKEPKEKALLEER